MLALWVGLEVYTKGFDHAFDGALASFGSGESRPAGQSSRPTERARDAVTDAHAEAEARRQKLLGD